MTRDPRYDILFEPVKIGPVTARNRFYQVPHCNGMGYHYQNEMAAMRGMKAEGGWAVVFTEQCDIHHSGDIQPATESHLWDDADLPYLAQMTEAVHRHGSLAGIELVHNGYLASNLYSREIPIGLTHRPGSMSNHPVQARAMDKADIRNYRRWHRNAALRAKRAGFDIVCVYSGHDLNVPMHFLSRRHNERTDEYGGSLENRLRLYRELIEETKDAVGDSCGVVVRFAVDELLGSDGISCEGEGRDAVEMLAELPDLWDVNISDWANDSATSRFKDEGYQEPFIDFVKRVTTKPVVGVGRYTSPDTMVSAIRRGVLDMIGAARPSIADPFLPKKIEEGRIDDIRECIGCNICVSGNKTQVPMRCTQNPTMGEEWRRRWHPEKIAAKTSEAKALIVGAGPAGLEAARALGQRGYAVTIAEAADEPGGRVTLESRLPGLATWARVRDYRLSQIAGMANVELFLASTMTAAEVIEFGADTVAIATGASWRRDGVGREHRRPIAGSDGTNVLTPDDIMAGAELAGPVVVLDDDHYYMGSVIAERLCEQGHDVVLVTPGLDVANWTHYTLEQELIERRLVELGVEILARHDFKAIAADHVDIVNALTGQVFQRACGSVVMVTARLPNDALYHELVALAEAGTEVPRLSRIGDCYGPGTIAAAVYAGHRYAREYDVEIDPDKVPFERELHVLTGVL